METKQVIASSIKPGSFILIDGVCCKAVDISVSKSGKHGSAKARIVAIGLLDGKKRDIVVGSQSSVDVPIIDKRNAQVLSVSTETINVMDQDTYETFDMKIPEEFKDKIQEGNYVQYWVIGGEKVIKQVRGE